jgi:cyclopropane fatty-acyl-phospholipid synthase-like methyltransferase
VTSQHSVNEVASYYESKTQAILRRYGPGPRVHFHTGFVYNERFSDTFSGLRSQLRESQERMLEDAAESWQLKSVPFRDVLDVGCGLGGGAIFWAQEFGANVTAITTAPSHINLVAAFAAQAGVGSRVYPLLCDALEVTRERPFDAVIAIDSSCHLNRREWFRHVAGLLPKGGHLFVADCFLQHPKFRSPFDKHWHAQIGTTAEYLAAGQEADLTLKIFDDVSQRAAHFWTMTLALIRAEAHERRAIVSPARLRESLQVHNLMRQGLIDGGLRYALMSFAKERP